MKKSKENSGFFKKNYKDAWDFLKEIKWFFVICLGIFCFFLVFGFIFQFEFITPYILDTIKKIALEMQGMNVWETILYIFWNNVKASVCAVIFGIVFGIFPLLIGIFNGYFAGFISRMAVEQNGYFILWRLLPHGIFEIPAIILSISVGLKLGINIFRKWKSFKDTFLKAIKILFFIIIPLLVIAAIIEGILVFCKI